MKIGRSTGYAILATCYVAENTDKKTIVSQEISDKYDIPLEYLLKILQQLVRGNILRSKRGPRGGFSLARPINKITMLQVIEAVDGPMVNHMSLADYTRKANSSLKADKIFDKALAQARAVYKKTKLSDIVGGK